MAADSTLINSLDFRATLMQAARGDGGDRPSPETVVDALLQAEKTAKQNRTTYPFESLLGRWRLRFATGTRKARQRGGIILGKGFYVPKLAAAYIAFAAPDEPGETTGKGEISNQAQLGPLMLKLTGPCQYLGKKNLLAFDFTQMQLAVSERTLYSGNIRGGKAKADAFYSQSIAKHPFFAFFLITEDFIAARGRGGGLALWIRVD